MTIIETLLKKGKLSLVEGVYDPGILKAIFTAGGPGSGKTKVAKELFNIPPKSTLSSFGLKQVNSDIPFEHLLKKTGVGMKLADLTPAEFSKVTSSDPSSLRSKAKKISTEQYKLYLQQKLGVIVDGTGDDLDKIRNEKGLLEQLGYDCFMVFVNTDLEVALERNRKRSRTIPEELVKESWHSVQKNIGHFQSLFRGNFSVIDNSDPGEINRETIKFVHKFLAKPTQNITGRQWIENEMNKEQR